MGTEWENHVYTVGGCVRDELMGSEIKDIDLCVSLPSGGVRFAEWLRDNGHTHKGMTVYPNYGTAMLHLKAFPEVELEFVQSRKEKYIDHTCRNPETAFGSIEDDCMRRDLTINALYCNVSTGEIVDITGKGVEDIKNHVIRTPNAPDVIYDDDPLRILRCIRFASRYGWEIETDTYDGLERNMHRLSIITKELLYQYTRIKGRKLNSKALEANAWHHRSDALSSIGAAIGIGGAIILGNRWTVLDPLASIVVGAMLVKVAWDLLGPSFGELTDSSLPASTEQEMLQIISSVEGVEDPHNLRTRRIGNRIAAEVHIRLDGNQSLEEAHEKASEVERRFRDRFGAESHIIVHMEPKK